MTTRTQAFGDELRRWRQVRRLSQLELANQAEVSQRHLSFLENGRSKPSPEMVVHLGRVLDLSLRDQNQLLGAAGYAPAFAERDLDSPDLDHVRQVLATLLEANGHYPMYVIDRAWNLVMSNSVADLLPALVDPPPPPDVATNALRLALHPEGLKPVLSNWDSLAASLLHRTERELAHNPQNERLQAVYDEVKAYPGVGELPPRPSLPDGADLVVSFQLRLNDTDLRFFTTITTIGAPFDITLEELRLEMVLPADDVTDRFLREAVRDMEAAS